MDYFLDFNQYWNSEHDLCWFLVLFNISKSSLHLLSISHFDFNLVCSEDTSFMKISYASHSSLQLCKYSHYGL